MKTKINLVIFIILVISVFGKAQKVDWVTTIGGLDDDVAYNFAVDNENNLFIAGSFSGKVDFDPGPKEFFLTGSILRDIFLLKLNSKGEFVWAKIIDTWEGNSLGITVDSLNNIILEYFFINISNKTVVKVKKISKDGIELWEQEMRWFGFVGVYKPKSISSEICIFEAGCDEKFYDHPFSIIKGDGNCSLTYEINEDKGFAAYDLYSEYDGSAKVIGEVYGTVTFNWGNNSYTIGESDFGNNTYRRSTFLLDVSYQGKLNEARIINYGTINTSSGQGGGVYHTDMDIDSEGNIFLISNSNGTIEYGQKDKTVGINHGLQGGSVIQKFTSKGELLWVKALQTPRSGTYNSIKINSKDEIVIGGLVTGSLDADPNDGVVIIEALNKSFGNLFILKLDNDGKYLWSKDFGFSYGAVRIDQNDNIFVNGIFSDKVTLNTINGVAILEPKGFSDIFTMKIKDDDLSATKSLSTNKNIKIYPNPASQLIAITIENDMEPSNVVLTNVNGQCVFRTKIESNLEIDISNLPNGFYVLTVLNNRGCISKPLVITK
jgi:hypothetical protein